MAVHWVNGKIGTLTVAFSALDQTVDNWFVASAAKLVASRTPADPGAPRSRDTSST